MDIKFIKPFFDATVKVFETMVQTKVVPSQPKFKEDTKSTGDVSAVVSMLGQDICGTFVVSFSESVFIKIISKMFMEDIKEITPENLDAAAELANMIYGNAKKDLIEQKISNLDKAIPTVVAGKGHFIKYQNGNSKIFVVPFQSELGEFQIELCKQEALK